MQKVNLCLIAPKMNEKMLLKIKTTSSKHTLLQCALLPTHALHVCSISPDMYHMCAVLPRQVLQVYSISPDMYYMCVLLPTHV